MTTNETNKTNGKGLLPKLRFPEFRKKEPWTHGYLDDGNVARLVTDRITVGDIDTSTYVSTENLLPDFAGVTTANKLPSSGALTAFQRNDVLIANIRPYLKKVWFSNKDGGASNDVLVVRAQESVFSTFLLFVIKRDAFISYVMKGAKGVKMPRGDIDLIKQYPIAYPKPAEQQKIADCLSSLDDLIAAHTDKLDALKTHKKGLLQQLFPREGETVPRLRFPEFVGNGAWRSKPLGEVGNVLMCKRIFSSQTSENGGVPFFKIGTIDGDPDSYISQDLFSEYKSKYNYPRKGEVLITCSGTVGKCLQFDGKDAYFQDSNIVWIDNPTLEISNDILYLLLVNVDWERLNSTTITRIYNPDLKNLILNYPSTEAEQKKIANCLFVLDDRIHAQRERIDALNAHKKGLLQQLFPTRIHEYA